MNANHRDESGQAGLRSADKRHLALIAAGMAGLGFFLVLTNAGFLQRVFLLIDQQRWGTLIGFVGIWGLSVTALLIAAFQPNRALRAFWACVVAVTAAIGVGFRNASGNELSVLDAISLWNVRHEASRAMDFYSGEASAGLAILALGLVAMLLPPAPRNPIIRAWLTRLAWAPALPLAAIVAIIFLKEGGGAQALPVQFTPLSVSVASGISIATNPTPERREVAWVPASRKVKNVVLLVDESIRGDYLDWTPGNRLTPALARLKSRIVDFGPAVSGGTCSHYSNALLRFTASRDDVGAGLLANPTIWQYAKKAGFRTVFIDAQAAFNRNPGKLQNFMTADEARAIDDFEALPETLAGPQLDDRLLDVMIEKLRSDEPVFIYANKNGAHFPYDRSYPPEARPFRPTMAEGTGDAGEGIRNSYRNAVQWSVDRVFERMLTEADLSETVILYTSDHGQALGTDGLSHCSVEDPNPREALVPMLVVTGDDGQRARFETAARNFFGQQSHFALVPAALDLMGYAAADIRTEFDETLLAASPHEPSFTSGDIFGLFSDGARWHPIDPGADYLEAEPAPIVTSQIRGTPEPASPPAN